MISEIESHLEGSVESKQSQQFFPTHLGIEEEKKEISIEVDKESNF